MKLPKQPADILSTPLNWGGLLKHEVIERVARPWVGKKIKEYMGVEDQGVVQMIIKVLNGRPHVEQLRDKLKTLLDEKTEEFVVKLW